MAFDKSGSEAATQWKGAENRDRTGLALGQFQCMRHSGIALRALDFDVENIGLRLAGHGARDDASEADLLPCKRTEEFMEAPALVQQGGHECRALSGDACRGFAGDGEKIRHIDLLSV